VTRSEADISREPETVDGVDAVDAEVPSPLQRSARSAESAKGDLVPTWLAALVLVLLLAVMLVGGFVIRGLVTRSARPTSPQELAISTWVKRVNADNQDAGAHLGLGYAYQAAGQLDKALDQYNVALKLDPKSTAAYYNRGHIYLLMGVGDRAEKSFWEVLNIDPTHVLAAKSLGDYYDAKGYYKSLIQAVKPAADSHPEMADLQYLVGKAYEQLGDQANAIIYYRSAVKYAPDLTEAQEALKRLGATR